MRYFLDNGVLMLFGLAAAWLPLSDNVYSGIHPVYVLAFLCALMLICAGYFLESGWIVCICGLLFAAAAYVRLEFVFFVPVAVYTLLGSGRQVRPLCWHVRNVWPAAVGLGVYICHFYKGDGGSFMIFGLLSLLLAVMLEKNTEQYVRLTEEFRRTRDDGRERNILLFEKNKMLVEKQNSEIYAATLKERNRIAREIHDNVGHVLSRSILMVGAMKAVMEAAPANAASEAGSAPLKSMLDNLDSSLNDAMDSIRSSVHNLHDTSVDLRASVEHLVNGFTFCPVDLQYDMRQDVPAAIRFCFISITKEALSNVIKHSNASLVRITLREHPALYQLCIEDNGAGRSSGSTLENGGMGLVNMEDRVRALKGTFQVFSGSGFKIFITIPK